MSLRLHALAALLTLSAGAQAASFTLYTNQAAYLAAVGVTRAYTDFAGSPGTNVPGGSLLPGVVFGSCTDPNAAASCASTVLHNSDGITDVGGAPSTNGVSALAWRFELADVRAFAFHYVSGAIDGIHVVSPIDLALSFIDTSTASGFIGLVSDTAFYGGIGVNAQFPNDLGADRYFIDDFRVNDLNRVPEPSSLLLGSLALGLALRGRVKVKVACAAG